MSDIAPCIGKLHTQAKAATCHTPSPLSFSCHIKVSPTVMKSLKLCIPDTAVVEDIKIGSAATPPMKNIRIIQGAQTAANCATFLNPLMAT